ncbi:Flagellar motor switch protein FliM [Planctomycetes bacterium Pan216]|uniref:Flagellar motor switch protein FliM n=1 Tax=Kolteria novifilia TaxID=2527975 RepID=A0A518BC05_9BACT|nr:Flagellar motor switch protein FliM [Planctomycetes bacterium Pan216]
MGDVLSQEEVEQLLAQVNMAGGAAAAASLGSEAFALPAGGMSASSDVLPPDITLYDFKRPERVGKEHMRALQSIHEGFSRNLSASLSGYLRTIVDVKLVSVDQLTYSEFIFSLENPTCFNVLKCEPLEGRMVLEINPSIVFPIIDRLLGGGRGDVLVPRRALTDIEQRLVGRITAKATDGLQQVWENIIPIDFHVDQIESNPQLVYIVPPNEVIVLVSFELTIGEIRGMMNLCIPFNVIEPVIGKLSSNTWFTYGRKRGTKRDEVVHQLANAPIDLVAFVGETTMTAEQLADLQVGDLLPIDKVQSSPFLVTIAGQPKFRARPFTLKGRKVVRIEERAEPNARING